MQTVIKNSNGLVINIGPWDYQMVPVMGDDIDKPITGTDGQVIAYEQKQIGEQPLNPLPCGAYEDQVEVVAGPDEGRYAAEDYRTLREAAYPPIGDQLDALLRAGAFPPDMGEQLNAVKKKYPKPEAPTSTKN